MIRNDPVGRAALDDVVGHQRIRAEDESGDDLAAAIEFGHRLEAIAVEPALDEHAVDLLADPPVLPVNEVLDRRMRVYLAPKLLIIDEFGVCRYDRMAATALFALVSARYERGSMILTSNKGFGEWSELLGDPVIATAILDPLLHHCHVLNIRGESYRLREKKRASLLPATGPTPQSRPQNRRAQVNFKPAQAGQKYAGVDTR